VAVEVVLLSHLSMSSESFLAYMVMSWIIEQFVNFSSSLSWCLLVYLHFFRSASYTALWVFLPETSDSQSFFSAQFL